MSRPLTGYPDQATVDLARATARAAGFDAIAEVIWSSELHGSQYHVAIEPRPPLPTGGETR